jgi:NAD/NADP transhydrogenase beta subunit
MNDDNNSDTLNIARIGRATRFAVACVVLGISYFSIRASLSITAFERIFGDMLGPDEKLPALTIFVLKARLVFVAFSFAIPSASIGLLFTRNIARSLYVLGILVLLALIMGIVLFHGMTGPLLEILQKMQDPAPTR